MKLLHTLLTILFVWILLIVTPQNPAANDETFIVSDSIFGSGEGFDFAPLVSVKQPDGNVIAAGGFTLYNLETQNRIIRLNEFGIKDGSFEVGTGFNSTVYSLALQEDGKILAGGLFSHYNGYNSNRLARLNSDGSFDSEFNIGSGFSGEILSIVVQQDGKIIVGGLFTSFNDTSKRNILRLNPDGSLDESFQSPSQINGSIDAIAIQPDGKILIGGFFTTINNESNMNIARLNDNGTIDDSFLVGDGFDNGSFVSSVNVIKILDNGKILVGGFFSSYDNNTCKSLVRINPDGSYDQTFNSDTGLDSWVYSIKIQDDGKLIIGGSFTKFDENDCFGLVRISSDGQLDNSFKIDNDFLNSAVSNLSLLDDGSVIVLGWFIQFPSTGKNRIVRLNDDGTVNKDFNKYTGLNRTVLDIKVQDDGNILVGGDFTRFHNISSPRLIRLTSAGLIDPDFNVGLGFNEQVNTILPLPDVKILVGGAFSTYNNQAHNCIVRLNPNGMIDETFLSGEGFNASVNQIVGLPDGKVLAGGAFTQYNGTEVFRILRLNYDGSIDHSFNIDDGFNGTVNCIAVQENGAIVVGGRFNSFGDINRGRIARLDPNGYLDDSFDPGTGFDNVVFDLAISQEGKILVGGSFLEYNGVSKRNLVRLNTDGSIDDTFLFFGAMNFAIHAILIQEDDKPIIGGTFGTINYKTLFRLMPDGQVDASFDVGNGFTHNRIVSCLALQQDGKILVGGFFAGYNGIARKRIARLVGDSLASYIPEVRPLASGTIYPNPSSGDFTVKLDKSYQEINMYVSDNLGRIIDRQRFINSTIISHRINGSPGLYFITLEYDNKWKSYKLLLENP